MGSNNFGPSIEVLVNLQGNFQSQMVKNTTLSEHPNFCKIFARIFNIAILKGLPRWTKKNMVDLLSRSLTLSTENLATPGGKFKIGNFILHLQLQQPSNQKLKTYYWYSNSVSNYAHFETNISSLFALSTNFEIGGPK